MYILVVFELLAPKVKVLNSIVATVTLEFFTITVNSSPILIGYIALFPSISYTLLIFELEALFCSSILFSR
ncbi:unknown [Clostridium sp. CAG:921]|nr:unknown [Clostridium sp. CAG:921]